MFPANDQQHQLFLIFILAGLSAGSVISYSADILSAIGYSVSVIAPLLIRLLIAGDSYSLTMSMAVVLYLCFMIVNSKHYYSNQNENIILNIQAIEREQAMHARMEWHEAILAGTTDGYWLVDMQGQLLEVNETYSQMSGYSTQELLEMRISDIEVIESPNETAAHIKKIKEVGEDRFESRHRRKNGTTFDVEISVQYRFIEGGQIVVFLRDITAQKHEAAKLKLVQIALNGSLDRYRDLYEFAPIGYISINHDGVITEVNWKATSLFGLGRNMLNQQRLDKFVIDDQKNFWENHFESMKHLESGDEISFELNLIYKDGSTFTANFNCLKTDDEDDQAMLSITLTDISKLKQIEGVLKQRDGYQRALVDNFPFLVWLKDKDGRFLAANKPFAKAAGFSSSDKLLGKTDFDICPHKFAAAYQADDQEVMDSGTPKTIEELIEINGEQILFETYKSPVLVEGEVVGIVGFTKEILDRSIAAT
jgi:PAS domain S-box-containing protein